MEDQEALAADRAALMSGYGTRSRRKLECTQSDFHPHSSNKVPREILSHILQEYMYDFFSDPRDPASDIPAILAVCPVWRQTAINDPQCWTKIWARIDTSLPYVRQNPASRTSRARAIQDTLNTYFARAKPMLVAVTMTFLYTTWSRAQRSQSNLHHWISNSLPKMKSYEERGSTTVLGYILNSLEAGRYRDLTHLQLFSVPNLDGWGKSQFELPKLQTFCVAYLPDPNPGRIINFLRCFTMPCLSHLRFSSEMLFDRSATATLFAHLQTYANLEELVLLFWHETSTSDVLPNPIHSVRRLELFFRYFDEHWSSFSFFAAAFPNLSHFVLDTDMKVSVTSPPRQDMSRFSSVTSLSI